LRKFKLLFILLHDIKRPNLTFFLCFNVKTIKKTCLRPEKNNFNFSKNHTMGGYCVKISKNFETFVPTFLHIPKVLTLKNNHWNYCAVLISRLATINFSKLRKLKLLFILQHDIKRPNLTFFLCFNVKTIKKSCLRPEKTTLIFSKITQWGGIVWKFQKISKILCLLFYIFLKYSL